MDRDTALRLLGLAPSADDRLIDEAVRSRSRELEDRRAHAPLPALREQYDAQLQELRRARAALHSSGAVPAVSVPRAELEEGAVVADRFKILRRSGSGPLGAVYAAHDRTRDREVSLFLPVPKLLAKEEARRIWLADTRAAAELAHPGIARTFDAATADDLPWVSSELLDGKTLREEMRKNRRFEVEEGLRIAGALCEALEYAHPHLVHRDLTPDHVVLCKDGTVKITGFGIARILSTNQLRMMGGYYAAPELMQGDAADGRADQYSVAAIVYEMWTGEVPAGRSRSARELRRDLSPKLSKALDRALSDDAAARFPDLRSFGEAMSRGASAVGAKPYAIGAALIVLLALGVTHRWWLGLFRRDDTAVRRAERAREDAAREARAWDAWAAESPVREPPEIAQAKEALRVGEAHFAGGRPGDAARLFEDARVLFLSGLAAGREKLAARREVEQVRAGAAAARDGLPDDLPGAAADFRRGEQALAAEDWSGAIRMFTSAGDQYRTAAAIATRRLEREASAARAEARRLREQLDLLREELGRRTGKAEVLDRVRKILDREVFGGTGMADATGDERRATEAYESERYPEAEARWEEAARRYRELLKVADLDAAIDWQQAAWDADDASAGWARVREELGIGATQDAKRAEELARAGQDTLEYAAGRAKLAEARDLYRGLIARAQSAARALREAREADDRLTASLGEASVPAPAAATDARDRIEQARASLRTGDLDAAREKLDAARDALGRIEGEVRLWWSAREELRMFEPPGESDAIAGAGDFVRARAACDDRMRALRDALGRLDPKTFRELAVPFPGTSFGAGLAFSPDGRFVAAGAAGHEVKLWNAETGREEKPAFPALAGPVRLIAFSPDGRKLAAAGPLGVAVWTVSTRGRLCLLRTKFVPESLRFAAEAPVLILRKGAALEIWNYQTEERVQAPERQEPFALSPDGNFLAVAWGDQIEVRDLRTNDSSRVAARTSGPLAVANDGKRVAWFEAGKVVWRDGWRLDGKAESLQLTPDERWLLVLDRGTLRIVDVSTGKEKRSAREVESVTAEQGTVLARLTSGGIRWWAPERDEEGSHPNAAAAVLSGDGRAVAWKDTSGAVRIGSKLLPGTADAFAVRRDGSAAALFTGTAVTVLDGAAKERCRIPEEDAFARCVRTKTDARRFVIATQGRVLWWDAGTMKSEEIATHERAVRDVAFAGDRVFAASGDVVREWGSGTGRAALRFGNRVRVVDAGRVLCEVRDVDGFAFDGVRLACVEGAVVRIVDPESGKVLKELKHERDVTAVALDSKGGFAFADDAGTIRHGGGSLRLGGTPTSLAFSPGGTYLAVGDSDGRIRFLKDLEVVHEIAAHPAAVRFVGYALHGYRFVSLGADGSLKIWGPNQP